MTSFFSIAADQLPSFTGFQEDAALWSAIEDAKRKAGASNLNVVRASGRLDILTDFELKMRANSVELVFTTDNGFEFQPVKHKKVGG